MVTFAHSCVCGGGEVCMCAVSLSSSSITKGVFAGRNPLTDDSVKRRLIKIHACQCAASPLRIRNLFPPLMLWCRIIHRYPHRPRVREGISRLCLWFRSLRLRVCACERTTFPPTPFSPGVVVVVESETNKTWK